MHTRMEKRRRKEWLTDVCRCFLFSFYPAHRLSQMHAYNKDTVNSFCCEEQFWARGRWVETHRFGELAARLHDPEAQRDYLRVQQKVDDLLLISLTREGEKRVKRYLNLLRIYSKVKCHKTVSWCLLSQNSVSTSCLKIHSSAEQETHSFSYTYSQTDALKMYWF